MNDLDLTALQVGDVVAGSPRHDYDYAPLGTVVKLTKTQIVVQFQRALGGTGVEKYERRFTRSGGRSIGSGTWSHQYLHSLEWAKEVNEERSKLIKRRRLINEIKSTDLNSLKDSQLEALALVLRKGGV